MKALLHMLEPHAEIIIYSDSCFILCKGKAYPLPNRIFNELISDSLIHAPQAIDGEHAKCLLTTKGLRRAKAIEASKTGYFQQRLFEEEITASAEPEQASLFDAGNSFADRLGSSGRRSR